MFAENKNILAKRFLAEARQLWDNEEEAAMFCVGG